MPRVSVIIPCFNQGQYLTEAVTSVLNQSFQDFEIIVVNDGSTDSETNAILRAFSAPKTTVLETKNQGLGAARNFAIRASRGEYILPLDADDRIGESYIEKAVRILDEGSNVGIVYCEAELFGARSGPWKLKPYRFPDILLHNVIFASAMFRKSDWEMTDGYRAEFAYWEDFDFWLSIIELGRDVVQIPEVLFNYRKHATSKTAVGSRQQLDDAHAQIWRAHPKLFNDNLAFIAGELSHQRRRIAELEGTIDAIRGSGLWRARVTLGRTLRKLRRTAD